MITSLNLITLINQTINIIKHYTNKNNRVLKYFPDFLSTNYETKRFNRDGQDMQDKKRQLHHEESEGKPGSAGRLTGFMHFAFGDQRLAVGSRPAVASKGSNCLFARETLTVQGSPLHPSS
ncbi:MAG: hypothetical protein WCI51_06780, partial [Lentisphaerota bacterium]